MDIEVLCLTNGRLTEPGNVPAWKAEAIVKLMH